MTQFSKADCLALVERSPQAVAVHDKAAWLALFARYSVVEDPVGSAAHVNGLYEPTLGHRGRARLGQFYETFIAPNRIRFRINCDVVAGLHVMRDLTIEIAMSDQVTVHVPVHLLYELCEEEGELRILRLAAHWELWPMLKQQMASGLPFLRVGGASAYRMLRHLGVRGMLGFVRALGSVGDQGKLQLQHFASHLASRNSQALQNLFARPDCEVAFPCGAPPKAIAECAAMGGEMHLDKVLAAGNTVSATVHYHHQGQQYSGVALLELDSRTLKIVEASFYWDES